MKVQNNRRGEWPGGLTFRNEIQYISRMVVSGKGVAYIFDIINSDRIRRRALLNPENVEYLRMKFEYINDESWRRVRVKVHIDSSCIRQRVTRGKRVENCSMKYRKLSNAEAQN